MVLRFVAFLLTREPSAVPRGWTTTRRFPAPGTEAWALFVHEPGGGGGTFSSRSHTEDNSHTSFQVTVLKPSRGKPGPPQGPRGGPRPLLGGGVTLGKPVPSTGLSLAVCKIGVLVLKDCSVEPRVCLGSLLSVGLPSV